MPNLGIEIKRKCEICGNIFVVKTLDSIYCSPKCSKIASKRKKDKEKKKHYLLHMLKQFLTFVSTLQQSKLLLFMELSGVRSTV